MEQERVREREPEPGADKYEETLRERAAWVERSMTGQVLIRSEDRQFERNRQGHIKHYLNPQYDFNTALDEWIARASTPFGTVESRRRVGGGTP